MKKNLPFELINKILSFRVSNPIANILKPIFIAYNDYNNNIGLLNYCKHIHNNIYNQFLMNKLHLKIKFNNNDCLLNCWNCKIYLKKLYYVYHNNITFFCYSCIKNIPFQSYD